MDSSGDAGKKWSVLEKKGLTSEEILQAFKLAEVKSWCWVQDLKTGAWFKAITLTLTLIYPILSTKRVTPALSLTLGLTSILSRNLNLTPTLILTLILSIPRSLTQPLRLTMTWF